MSYESLSRTMTTQASNTVLKGDKSATQAHFRNEKSVNHSHFIHGFQCFELPAFSRLPEVRVARTKHCHMETVVVPMFLEVVICISEVVFCAISGDNSRVLQ